MMTKTESTLFWLLSAVAVAAVMVGYYLGTEGNTARELPSYGVITGIIYSEEKPSVAINGKIVHEAETIDGVKVVKIYRDKVEFEKNKKRWTQRVRQRPNRNWLKVN